MLVYREMSLAESLIELGVSGHPRLEWPVIGEVLNADAVGRQEKGLAHSIVLLSWPASETPFARHEQLLTTRELELRSSEGLDDVGLVLVLTTNAQHSLSNVDASDQSLGLSKSSSHSGLEPISSGARQHLVDTNDVEGVDTDAHVEGVFAHHLDHVLVGADTSRFEGLGGELFMLVGDHVDAQGKFIDASPLTTQVVNTNLGIRDTPAETRLGVRFVLAVPIAPRRPATHL